MRRRTFLTLPALAGGAAVLAACTADEPPGATDAPTDRPMTSDETWHTYGDDPSQFGELHLPTDGTTPRGVVVVIHGGFWRAEYDLSLGTPLAQDLASRGWAAWNLEYRRVGSGEGSGGGAPATFDDVAAGIDLLRELDLGVDPTTVPVVTLGHSAGGHLAAWAASRTRDDRWATGLPVTHVISQAGVLDLVASARDDLGGGAATALLGHEPTSADSAYDPRQQVPLDQPVWCVHGRQDPIVPLEQSASYVSAATSAGAQAELVEVDGDHFVVIDPGSDAWARTVDVLDGIA